ncbi:hypothetical protein IWW36_000496 [Coemansia brasiliensis]|uniref:Phorbol-ester/DAG-type domain-containing protein n=1 Tax=Coemansia brasiliensis TaxID=2650707 RepID=A0A9W8M181_9FUNG|nr:hypothetical protein IWW36_000496 [Coemansia brasiliensis]
MHDYRETTFLSPTYCELCGGFLWGVSKQGVRCIKCQLVAHKSCAFDLETRCPGDRGLATLVANGRSEQCSRGFSLDNEQDDNEYMRRLDSMFWQQVDEETKINNLVSLQAEQPLSLFQTLPANFMQFTAKLAPLSLVHREATDVVFWRRPLKTLAAMGIYTVYCLHPHLLLATPLALMIAYIVFRYFSSGCYQRDVSSEQPGKVTSNTSIRTLSKRLGGSLLGIVPLGAGSLPAPPTAVPCRPQSEDSGGLQQRGRVRERRRSSQPAPYRQISSKSSLKQVDSARSHDEALPPLRVSADTHRAGEPHRRNSSSGGLMSSRAGSRELQRQDTSSAPTSPKPSVLVRSPTGSETRSGRVDLEALLGVASFGSTRYTENVHTTQTMTGAYVSLYDWVAENSHKIDWSDPAQTRRVLAYCIWAQVAVMVVGYWIPWHWLFLAGGNAGVLSMSPHVRAFSKIYGVEFALYVHEWIMVRWAFLRHRAARAAMGKWTQKLFRRCSASKQCISTVQQFESPELFAQDSDDDTALNTASEARNGYITPPSLLSLSSTAGSSASTLVRRTQAVSVFENQRWWLGFGWIPRLGSRERAKWSDESGCRRFSSIKDFMPEDGYEWADNGSGWEIDCRWALPVRPDEDGWIYTDNFWRRPAAAPQAMSSYTRRRRWVRKVRPARRSDTAHAASSSTT